jgi:hypothetical protein
MQSASCEVTRCAHFNESRNQSGDWGDLRSFRAFASTYLCPDRADVANWQVVRKATEFVASCMQDKARWRLRWTKEFIYENQFSNLSNGTISGDILW